jgi:hypothetical protein
MSKKTNIFLLGIGATIIILAIGLFTPKVEAAQGIPDSADSKEIMAVMDQAYEAFGEVAQTHDVSKFSGILIDTPDFKLNARQSEKITGMLGSVAAQKAGYLTMMQAKYLAYAKGNELLKKATDKAKAENREITVEEFQAVIKENYGQVPQGSVITTKTVLVYESINIDGDKAIVRYDDGAALQEAILVYIKGKWLIAGITPINIHF